MTVTAGRDDDDTITDDSKKRLILARELVSKLFYTEVKASRKAKTRVDDKQSNRILSPHLYAKLFHPFMHLL